MGKRVGRPALPPPERRSEVIFVRLRPGQAAQLRAEATAAGLHLADFARELISKRRVVIVPQINRAAWVELARTAANLNQLTKLANQITKVGRTPSLNGSLKELPEVLAEMRKALGEVRLALLEPDWARYTDILDLAAESKAAPDNEGLEHVATVHFDRKLH